MGGSRWGQSNVNKIWKHVFISNGHWYLVLFISYPDILQDIRYSCTLVRNSSLSTVQLAIMTSVAIYTPINTLIDMSVLDWLRGITGQTWKNTRARDFATLHSVQHCIPCKIAFRATLHYMQHCTMCNIALRTILHYLQHSITCNIALRATLHYVKHCIICNIALCAILHYVQHCISWVEFQTLH